MSKFPPRDPTAFLIAALLGLVATFLGGVWLSPQFAPLSPRAFGVYAVTATYCGCAIWGCDRLVARWGDRGNALYFAVQFVLFCVLRELAPPNAYPWMLSLPVISQAAERLRWPGLVAVMFAYAGHLLAVMHFLAQARWQASLFTTLSVGAAFIFTVAFTRAAKAAEHARARAAELAGELESANARLREHAAQSAELAALQERNRIARDIHDGLGHYLTVVSVQLQAARALLAVDAARATDALGRAEQSNRAALDDVRRSVGALRVAAPPAPLPQALADLIAGSGLDVALRIDGAPRELPAAAAQALFRAAQEGLTNVRKHAGPARAEITLDFRAPARVAVEIADAGGGCTGAGPAAGFGLVGLRERCAALGGSLAAGNREAGGFSLRAEVPA